MKLYLITQSANNGYDTYDSAVVAARTQEEARYTYPSEYYTWQEGQWRYHNGVLRDWAPTDWAHPDDVTVTYLGTAKRGTKAGVITASFNAG